MTCPASYDRDQLSGALCEPRDRHGQLLPAISPTITQSPPCGTPLGPGINSVTVTVTDCHGNSTTKVVHLVVSGPQSFLSSLTNTGVGPGGSLLVDGTVDPHYSLPPAAVPVGMPADYLGNAVAVSDYASHGTGCAWLDRPCTLATVCPWNS